MKHPVSKSAKCLVSARSAALALLIVAQSIEIGTAQSAVELPYPILFVTQVPVPGDFATIGSVFGNHRGDVEAVFRGGDLWIRYTDGTLKNLTAAAGFGSGGFQGAGSIAVREPSMHWSGSKAVFSMVIGSPSRQFDRPTSYWQLYEITGLGQSDTPVIALVPNQPQTYNNVSPLYGTDDRIIFTSDLARNKQRHLSPQLDEYEEVPTVTGLWSLDSATGDLFLLQHSPSGSFSPQIDSFGRVVYVRWDHLQRDQQAVGTSAAKFGVFNFSDESANAARLETYNELFPEPLVFSDPAGAFAFNIFSPWTVNQDGTEEETLNHLGRHELQRYIRPTFLEDPNLTELIASSSGRTNPNPIENFLQIKESPTSPGAYWGVDAPEFETHAAGQVVRLNAGLGVNPDATVVTYVTHRDTRNVSPTAGPTQSGHYRNPLPLSNGAVIVVHTAETRADANEGTAENPRSRYAFRLKTLVPSGDGFVAGAPITPGISKSLSWWTPDVSATYSGTLWELDPVEVRSRPRPQLRRTSVSAPVQRVFEQQGVAIAEFQNYLRQNNLALLVSNNVTTRDRADRQQPYNLRVGGGQAQTLGSGGKVYDVSFLQLFQASQVRGVGGTSSPKEGRRVLPQFVSEPGALLPRPSGAPSSSVPIAADGSIAAIVPARRALSWQLTSADSTPVVRERYWVTVQPGEIRVCTSCHGVNTSDQAGQSLPANEPEALRQLLASWKVGAPGAPRNLRLVP